MLQSFLKQNKGALSGQFGGNQDPFAPSVHREQCCLPWQPVKNNPPTVSTVPTSPTYRRKKIFQNQQSPASKITAAFPEVSME